jgi:hypothetical protein
MDKHESWLAKRKKKIDAKSEMKLLKMLQDTSAADELNFRIDPQRLFNNACKMGSMNIMLPILCRVKIDVTDGFIEACSNGHLDIVQALHRTALRLFPTGIIYSNFLCIGTYEIKKSMTGLSENKVDCIIEDGFFAAIRNGHFNVIKYLLEIGSVQDCWYYNAVFLLDQLKKFKFNEILYICNNYDTYYSRSAYVLAMTHGDKFRDYVVGLYELPMPNDIVSNCLNYVYNFDYAKNHKDLLYALDFIIK